MKEKKTLGYFLGTAFGAVLMICAMLITIVLTFKFIFWIL